MNSVERICPCETGGIDSGSHICFGLWRPHSAVAVGTTSTYLTDLLGSTLAMASGGTPSVQTSWAYDPHGVSTVSGTANTNTFQYAGRENDGTSLVSMRNRYYNPAWGRFVSEDPIGLAGGSNLYRYAGNNGITLKDPSGNNAVALEGAIWGAEAGSVAGPLGTVIGGVGGFAIGFGLGVGGGYLVAWAALDLQHVFATPSGLKNNPAANGGCSATIVCNENNSQDGNNQQYSPEKQALVEMAKGDKRTGMTQDDMDAYKELNKELSDPFPENKVRGWEQHDTGLPSSQSPHGHVGPVGHIPISGVE